MYCEKCGKELKEGQRCPVCAGSEVKIIEQTASENPKNENNVSMGSIIFAILGLLGTVYSLAIIIKDTTSNWGRYTYTPPFTEHETYMLLLIVASVIIFIIGLYNIFNKK